MLSGLLLRDGCPIFAKATLTNDPPIFAWASVADCNYFSQLLVVNVSSAKIHAATLAKEAYVRGND